MNKMIQSTLLAFAAVTALTLSLPADAAGRAKARGATPNAAGGVTAGSAAAGAGPNGGRFARGAVLLTPTVRATLLAAALLRQKRLREDAAHAPDSSTPMPTAASIARAERSPRAPQAVVCKPPAQPAATARATPAACATPTPPAPPATATRARPPPPPARARRQRGGDAGAAAAGQGRAWHRQDHAGDRGGQRAGAVR